MKKQLRNNILLATISAAFAITSCNNSPYPGYELNENGVYSKFHNQNEEGVKPQEGDLVRLVMSYKNSKDSTLFDSQKGNPNGTNFIEFPLGKPSFKGSFEDALMMMTVGDSASFVISADSVYLKTFMAQEIPPYIEKGSMLTFEAKLEKITAKEIVEADRRKRMEEQKVMIEFYKNEEPKALAKYLTDNKINAKPTASGLYFIEKSKGKGAKPTTGAMAKVFYVGRFLDGQIFDTNIEEVAKQDSVYQEGRPYEPIEFQVGQVEIIPGWHEGVSMMSAGGKAKWIIPSSLAYGERGRNPIPPYTTLVFDIELVSFTPAK